MKKEISVGTKIIFKGKSKWMQLTPNKKYVVVRVDGDMFNIIHDDNDRITLSWKEYGPYFEVVPTTSKIFVYIKTSNGITFRAVENEQTISLTPFTPLQTMTIDNGEILTRDSADIPCWQPVTDFIFTFDTGVTMWRQEE